MSSIDKGRWTMLQRALLATLRHKLHNTGIGGAMMTATVNAMLIDVEQWLDRYVMPEDGADTDGPAGGDA